MLSLRYLSCLLLSAILFSSVGFAQNSFPEDWLGDWEGELSIYRGNELMQSIPMQMHIQRTADSTRIDWSTTYTSDKGPIEKPYQLQTVDPEKGQYLIDELNSIRLESYLFAGQKLVSWYDVQGSRILATHELQGERLVFEIIAGSTEAVSVSGGTGEGDEKIPEVITYPIKVLQRAVLTRKK